MILVLDPETTHRNWLKIWIMNEISILFTHEWMSSKWSQSGAAVLDDGKIVEESDLISLFKRLRIEITKKLSYLTI